MWNHGFDKRITDPGRHPSQEYFADGMTDQLITTLGQISAFRVISRTSGAELRWRSAGYPALQNTVARAIAEQIRINVTPQEQVALKHANVVNPDAYEAYLKGRYFWNKAIQLSEGNPTSTANLARAYAASGRRNEAVQLLNELKKRSSPGYSNAPEIAVIYTALGDRDPTRGSKPSYVVSVSASKGDVWTVIAAGRGRTGRGPRR
jgi:hypothetical protein